MISGGVGVAPIWVGKKQIKPFSLVTKTNTGDMICYQLLITKTRASPYKSFYKGSPLCLPNQAPMLSVANTLLRERASPSILYLLLCKVFLLFRALYAKCPYYVALYMQSVLVM